MSPRDLLSYNPEVFERPRYIQRLSAPGNLDNPYAFGAGTSGLSPAALERLRPAFSFEYMGAAEYENGAAAAAIHRIATGLADETYAPWAFQPRLRANRHYGLERPASPITLYGIGRAEHQTDIEEAVTALANWPRREHDQLKEPALIARTLRSTPGRPPRATKGWLELTNGFFVFRDEAAFTATLTALDLTA